MNIAKTELSTLNFLLLGNHFSGYGLLQSALNAHPQLTCHGEIFNRNDSIRRQEHEQYFGVCDKFCDHFVPTHISVEQYLNNKIFDRALNGERVIGAKTSYELLSKYDVWDFLRHKANSPDFCAVHVTRNPISCYVSLQQKVLRSPKMPVYVDLKLLTDFCRTSIANSEKINTFCIDRAVVSYTELILDFKGTLEKVLNFLELEYNPVCLPNSVKAARKPTASRVLNWTTLKKDLPYDLKELANDPALY